VPTDRGTWQRSAHCVRLHEDALSSPHGHRSAPITAELCSSCPVRPTCLGWALVTGAPEGVLGGVGPKRRQQLRVGLLRRLQGRPIAGSPELTQVVRANSAPPTSRSPVSSECSGGG
jgi:hypothetical protein